MGWSTSAPSGASFGSAKESSSWSLSQGHALFTAAIARGATNTIYIKVDFRRAAYDGYASYNISMTATVAGSSVTADGTWGAYSSSYTTYATRYYTGTASAGSNVTVTVTLAGSSRSVTLKAPAYTTKYTISYNGNDSTGGSTASQTKTYGSNITLQQNGFTKTGYHFVRWNTKADGSGTNYDAGASYTANAAVTLYAQWAINTYTVSYNGNSPNSTPVTNLPAAQTKTYGTALPLRETVPVCTGFVFSHWNTKADDSGTRYDPGASYTGNAALTLYAIWDGTWTVQYNGNGATGGSTPSQTKVEDVALAIQSNGFVRDKYTFSHWNTKADDSGTRYNPGASYTGNAALTLYAIWIKNNIPVYYHDGTTVRQIEKAYYKDDDGFVKECTLYYKDEDGEIWVLG